MASSLRLFVLLGFGLLFALQNDAFAEISHLETTAYASENREELPFTTQRLRSHASGHLLETFPLHSQYARRLTQTSRDNPVDARSRDEDAVCASLTAREEDCLGNITRSWLVNDDILVEAGNNLQAIINCVNDGDVLLLNVSERILVNNPIEIGNNVTISAVTESTCLVNGVYPEAEREATFTCPADAENGVFIVRSKDALFANLRFENCSLNKSRGAKAIIDVSKCRSDEGAKDGGDIRLHHVTFEGNVLNDTASLRMRPPACSALELIDIELKNNTCNGRCGIILSKERNRLRNVTVELTHQTAEDSYSTVFDAPDGSTIDATNVTAISNEVEIFHIDKGTLILQKSNLSNNALSFMAADHSFSVCLHLVNATADIKDCQFEENEGAEGAIVFAEQSSSVTMRNCMIEGTKATEGGGGAVVLQDKTTGTFVDCNFSEGHTDERGGFIAARDSSNMTIRRSQFKEATAKDGGCVYVSLSSAILLEDVTFEKCHSVVDGGALRLTNVSSANINNVNMISNSAGDDGGCMYAEFSKVTGTGWTVMNNTAGDHAGAFRIRLSSNVSITDSKFSNSQADRGGAVSLELESTARFEHVKFHSSSAATDGGVFSITESEITLFHCQLRDGSAENGGFLYSRKNASVTILHSDLTGGEARHGGCLRSLDGNLTVQDSTFRKCHSDEDGGAMHLANITVEISDSTFLENEAGDDGGAIYIEKTHANKRNTLAGNNETTGNKTYTEYTKSFRVNSTLFEKNVAANGGAMHLSSFDDETLDHQMLDKITSVGNRCFEFGGAVSIVTSTVHIARSSFRDGYAELSGAFVSARRDSSLVLEDCEMNNGSSQASGGAIAVYESTFEGRNIDISKSTAPDGGALFFEFSDIPQQRGELKDCTIRKNTADHGGLVRSSRHVSNRCVRSLGGLYVRSKDQSIQCSDAESNCTFITLSDTVFSQNRAEIAGGAAFADSSKMIQDDCILDPTAKMTVNVTDGETDGEDLSETDCKVWQRNKAGQYGPDIASFAHRTTASINVSTNDTEGDNRIENYESGDPMTIYLRVEDDRGQHPAIGKNDRYVIATISSEDQLFKGSQEFLVSDPVAEISITGFAKPGNYTLRIDFEEEGLESHKFEVQVKECDIGHVRHENGDLCVSCSSSTFSFLPETDKTCHPCPEDGNCTFIYILPNEGYWNHMPCSEHIQRCLTSRACDHPERQERLDNVANSLTDCVFNETQIEAYNEAQCREGHEGPLCGSCKTSYGKSHSLLCEKCFSGFTNAVLLLLSFLVLLILSAIGIRGNLISGPSLRQLSEDDLPSSVSGPSYASACSVPVNFRMVEMMITGRRSERMMDPGPSRRPDREIDPRLDTNDDPGHTDAELAKWKAIELFKITVNFLQVTAIAIAVNVKWTITMIALFETSEFASGITSEAVSRSLDCIFPAGGSVERSVGRTLFEIFQPLAAILVFSLFWLLVHIRSRATNVYRLLKNVALSASVVFYISYISLTKTLIKIFSCIEVHDPVNINHDSVSKYWAVDTSIECYVGNHALLLGLLGWPLFILFTFSFPIALGYVIIKNVADDYKEGWIYDVSGFMYRSYRKDYIFWESLIMLRKAILATVVVFSYPLGANLQQVLAAFVLIVALYLQTKFRPYRNEFDDLNEVESLCILVSSLTFISSIFFSDDHVSSAVRILVTLVVATLNLVFFALLFIICFVVSADYLRSVLIRKGVPCGARLAPLRIVFMYLSHFVYIPVRNRLGAISRRRVDGNEHQTV